MTNEEELALARQRLLQLQQGGAQEQPGGRQQIGTFADNGRVYRRPDGTLEAVSAGGATTNPETVERIMAGESFAQTFQRDNDEARIAANPVAARVQEFNQGVPFVGEWLDEAVGMVSPQAAENMRARSDAMERQRPGQSAALNIAGSIAGAAPMAAGALGWAGRAQTGLGTAGRAALAGAGAGAVEGAAAMSGRGEDGNRVQEGARGATLGAGFGLALGAIAPVLGDGVSNLARRIQKLDVRTIANEFGISAPAARVVKGYLLNEDFDAATRALARGGDDVMLAEAGPATRQLADTAMQTGGEALRVGRDAVSSRVRGASDQFNSAIDDILGNPEGVRASTRAVSQRTAQARQAAYDRAFAQPTPMTGAAGRQIEDVLGRAEPDVLRRALDEANAEMRDTGARNMNIMASIGDDGEVTFTQPLSVMQLDYLARGLYAVADAGTDNITGTMSRQAVRASRQAADLRNALKEAVPGYADALRIGGDAIRERQALETGRRVLNSRTTVEDVRDMLRDAPDPVREAARQGMRQNIDAVTGRVRATIADIENGGVDFETGANAVGEAMAAMRAMMTPDNMRKARIVLGQADADRLFAEMERLADVSVLRAAVARNTATAIRLAGQQQIRDEVAPGVLRRTAGNLGNPLDAAQEMTRSLAGIDPASMGAREREYLTEVARVLTQTRGADARRALIAVRQALQGQPIRDADADLIGRLVSGGAAGGAYQGAMQTQGR